MKRAFHVVYTLLALNFIIPVAIYIFEPNTAVESFGQIGHVLGAGPYPHSEDSIFWRVLGIANVATLGFCCVLIQIDLRRYYVVVLPLMFLKGMAAIGFGLAYLFEPYPSYLAACLFDILTVSAMGYFAKHAHQTVAAADRVTA